MPEIQKHNYSSVKNNTIKTPEDAIKKGGEWIQKHRETTDMSPEITAKKSEQQAMLQKITAKNAKQSQRKAEIERIRASHKPKFSASIKEHKNSNRSRSI